MRISDWSSDVCSSDLPLDDLAIVLSSGRGQRSLRLGDDGAERLALVHRDVGQNLALQFHPGQLQAVPELRIGQALGADAGVDALDPQAADGPLLDLALATGLLAAPFVALPGAARRLLSG